MTAFSEAMAIHLWQTGIKVLVVYPGVVDTDLFTLPDNDRVPVEVQPVPVSELVAGVLQALDDGAHEVYIPAYFKDIAAQKAADVPAFLAGCADYFAKARAGGRIWGSA